MSPVCVHLLVAHVLASHILPSQCFVQKTGLVRPNFRDSPHTSALFAKTAQLKGARKFSRRRPKKTRPSAVYPSPTLYYGNVHNHFGAPPEYLAIPVDETLKILRTGRLSELIALMKKGITGAELSEVLANESLASALSQELATIKQISETEACDVSCDLHMFFESILRAPRDYEHYIDKFHTMKKIQAYWEKREQMLYNIKLKQLFARLRSVAYKMQATGIPLAEFVDPELWHRYGVFKMLPRCRMVDNYLAKHTIAINFDIKRLYFRDPASGEIRSNFDDFYFKLRFNAEPSDPVDPEGSEPPPQAADSAQPTGFEVDDKGRLPPDLVDRLVADLTALGVFDPADPARINLSRIDELQADFSGEQSLHAYAIRDFYLAHRYPDYRVETDPFVLGGFPLTSESFLNHEFRTRTYERDLLRRYRSWLRVGAPRESFKPMNLKYQHLAVWHGLSKNQRRRLAQRYVKTLTTPVAAQSNV